MTSSPLSGVTLDIIRDVVTQSHFQYVIVMTTVSPQLYTSAQSNSDKVLEELEEQVLEWMGNMVINYLTTKCSC